MFRPLDSQDNSPILSDMDMASFLGDQTLLGTAERGRGERAQSAPKTKDSQQHKEGPRLHGAYDRSIT